MWLKKRKKKNDKEFHTKTILVLQLVMQYYSKVTKNICRSY